MVMKRFLVVLTFSLAGLGGGINLTGCDKPEADDCRHAIENMQRLLGTSTGIRASDISGEIRLCKGGSTREAVACAAKATTIDELKGCKFMGSKSAK
jgi:hypothetical protein